MPARILLTALLLVLGFAGEATALHKEITSIGIRAGYTEFLNPVGSDVTLIHGGSPAAGLTAEFRRGHFGLKLSADWMKVKLTTLASTGFSVPPFLVIGSIVVEEAELTVIPLLLTGQFHFMDHPEILDPYFGIGGGFYLTQYHPGPEIEASTKNAVGYHASMGANVTITRKLSLNFDARLAYANTEIRYKNVIDPPGGRGDLSLSGLYLTAGLRYTFQR
ncbi:MAG TPA: OmpW family outer membrane protein [Nitrospiria bacterium]